MYYYYRHNHRDIIDRHKQLSWNWIVGKANVTYFFLFRPCEISNSRCCVFDCGEYNKTIWYSMFAGIIRLSKHISRVSATIIYDVLVLINKWNINFPVTHILRINSRKVGSFIIFHFTHQRYFRFTQQRYYCSRIALLFFHARRYYSIQIIIFLYYHHLWMRRTIRICVQQN